MNNPFIIAMRANPRQFLTGLESDELQAICEGCVDYLAKRAEEGDRKAAPAIQALYRQIAEIEI